MRPRLLCLLLLLFGCGTDPEPLRDAAVLPDSGSGSSDCSVTAPPPGFGGIYTQYLQCEGIAVVATAGVQEEALYVADETMEFMLEGHEDVRRRLVEDGWYFILRDDDMSVSDLPEAFPASLADARGATEALIHAATSRGNVLLCSTEAWFFDNNVFLHEFVHVMHLGALRDDSAIQDEIEAAYTAARGAGSWDNTYAGSNSLEYFAELTQKWFEVGRRRGPVGGDGLANEIITRDELLAYDPRGYALVASVFNDRLDVPGCVQRTRMHPYLSPDFSCDAEVTDLEGNRYPLVRIGDQCWMATNLAVTHLRDGTAIPDVADDTEWSTATSPARCAYDNDPSSITTGGVLYNHASVTASAGLCPDGMREPTIEDIERFIRYTKISGGVDAVASQLRAVGAWSSEATDDYGFAARPTGTRDAVGPFAGLGDQWIMWSVDEDPDDGTRGASYGLSFDADFFQRGSAASNAGLAVRCVRD